MDVVLGILDVLTDTQRSRYVKHIAYGMTVRDIAAEEGCSHVSVIESLESAKKRIAKELKKRGYEG